MKTKKIRPKFKYALLSCNRLWGEKTAVPYLTDEQLVQNIRAAFDNFLSAITTAEAADIQTTIFTDFRASELLQFNQTIRLSTMARGCTKLRITKTYGDPL